MTTTEETASRINFGIAEVEVLHPKFIEQVRKACELAIQEAVAEERKRCKELSEILIGTGTAPDLRPIRRAVSYCIQAGHTIAEVMELIPIPQARKDS